VRTARLRGWSPPPPQDWGRLPSAHRVSGRLVWAALLAFGLFVVLAVTVPRDGAPGIGARSWAALGLAGLLAWRLTVARSKGGAALARTAGEWLVVGALLVLLAVPPPPPVLELPAGDRPVAVEQARRRPPARQQARPARQQPSRQQPAEQARSGLDALIGTFTDAWRQTFGPDSPTTRR
jgi:hypothetical protein